MKEWPLEAQQILQITQRLARNAKISPYRGHDCHLFRVYFV
jgi:hypothetical protein